jgi:hypothetical protein
MFGMNHLDFIEMKSRVLSHDDTRRIKTISSAEQSAVNFFSRRKAAGSQWLCNFSATLEDTKARFHYYETGLLYKHLGEIPPNENIGIFSLHKITST